MTYSIVACDRANGQVGVAMQSCLPAVGATAVWARPGAGAVATQGFAEPAYGPRCLDALTDGSSATDALTVASDLDSGVVLRQVGVVGVDGSVAGHTGQSCIAHAGHRLSDACAVQANMATNAAVWPAMDETFHAAPGSLSRRLLAALEAAQAAGGDARGMMAAALLVVDATPQDNPGAERLVDLRVDRSDNPLAELRRLLDVSEAYTHSGRAVEALASGELDTALTTIDHALAQLPGEQSLRLVRASVLLARGETSQARLELQALTTARFSWETIIRGFATQGLLPVPTSTTLDELLK